MRALLLIIAAVMACAGSAKAQDWQWVTDARGTMVAVDAESIRSIGNNKVAWFLVVFDETNNIGTDYYVARHEYDCRNERSRLLAMAAYEIDGTNLNSSSDVDPWKAVFPNSITAKMMEVICEPQEWDENLNLTASGFADAARIVMNNRPD